MVLYPEAAPPTVPIPFVGAPLFPAAATIVVFGLENARESRSPLRKPVPEVSLESPILVESTLPCVAA
jgi:hypothetical protein